MIQSMTGYGKSDAVFNGKKIHVEVKSLNSKALDLNARIAPLYREKEMEVRQLLAKAIERGKVDFTLWVEKDDTSAAATINPEAVKNYVAQIQNICNAQSLAMPQNVWDVVLRLPDATQTNAVEELTDEEWAVVLNAIQQAVDHLVDFRKQEGGCALQKV